MNIDTDLDHRIRYRGIRPQAMEALVNIDTDLAWEFARKTGEASFRKYLREEVDAQLGRPRDSTFIAAKPEMTIEEIIILMDLHQGLQEATIIMRDETATHGIMFLHVKRTTLGP